MFLKIQPCPAVWWSSLTPHATWARTRHPSAELFINTSVNRILPANIKVCGCRSQYGQPPWLPQHPECLTLFAQQRSLCAVYTPPPSRAQPPLTSHWRRCRPYSTFSTSQFVCGWPEGQTHLPYPTSDNRGRRQCGHHRHHHVNRPSTNHFQPRCPTLWCSRVLPAGDQSCAHTRS
ncbi:hypothetical protein C8F04DRAFT_1097080 [Mycena alexandri]|uniref:Uncharacterized protein n=1 Tax=Mycena alexandri TaxID=1745969 RepID=A0AAD6X8E3_9AGAR|nr:hypothetical protein C8F04DRAFT_1097080 [Mycena alexandri]